MPKFKNAQHLDFIENTKLVKNGVFIFEHRLSENEQLLLAMNDTNGHEYEVNSLLFKFSKL